MAFPNAHNQPGRRLAKGCTKDDIYLAAFGFVAHMCLFLCLGYFLPTWAMCTTGTLAVILLVIRGKQAGTGTTKESIQAIKDAFKSS